MVKQNNKKKLVSAAPLGLKRETRIFRITDTDQIECFIYF